MKKIIALVLTCCLAGCASQPNIIYGSKTNVVPNQGLTGSLTNSKVEYTNYICNGFTNLSFKINSQAKTANLVLERYFAEKLNLVQDQNNQNHFYTVDAKYPIQIYKNGRNLNVYQGTELYTCSAVESAKQREARILAEKQRKAELEKELKQDSLDTDQ